MTSTPVRRSGREPGRASAADRNGDRLARALGWASVGLGVPQLLRPGTVARAIGVGDGARQRAVATAVGARELAHAAGLLNPRLRRQWLWTRVAGDAIDLATLARALRHHDGKGVRRTVAATVAVAGIAAVDLFAAMRHGRSGGEENTMELRSTTTVGKPPKEVYEYWRQLDNLPRFMAHVDSVRVESDSRSHWTVTAPFDSTVEWDAEIVEDVPGERLSWRSVEGADVTNSGTVQFVAAPKDQGTEIHVTLDYAVPGGKLGEALARWAGEDPHQQLDDDLRRFKQVMETGEVVRSDGAPYGKRARKEFPQRAAQPLTETELEELHREEAGV